MKKIFILLIIPILVIIIISIWFLFFRNTGGKNSIIVPKINDSASNKSPTTTDKITPKTQGYKTVWINVNDKDRIFLFSNLQEKLNSKELATKNTCANLVSGGFYDKEGNHIGLFVSEGKTLNEIKDSTTFNGFFSISETGVVSITEYPIFSPRISLQTGPILIRSGEKLDLKIDNDEYARRVVVGVTKDRSIVFMAIYEQSNTFMGPTLSELPGIIEKVSKEKNLNLTDAINLDGGAHSAFISDLIDLSEASTIGSYFCINP